MILGLLVVSVFLGLASPWAAILPGAVAAYGAALIAGADSSPSGEADPAGLAGFLFLIAGGGCAFVVLVVGAFVRGRRAERERSENATREYV